MAEVAWVEQLLATAGIPAPARRPALAYPPTPGNPVMNAIAASANAFAQRLLPSWMAAADPVWHHDTSSRQSYEALGAALAIYALYVFVLVTVVDVVVVHPLTYVALRCTKHPKSYRASRKTAWLLLHALFNTLVTVVSLQEAWAVFCSPVGEGYKPAKWWGTNPGSLFGAIAIGAFHMHHFVFFSVTLEDVVHHLINAGVVVVIGALCPWGKFTALSNFAMCGVPGGLNYYVLWLRGLNAVSRMAQKRFNRPMNIVLRYPIQLITVYGLAVAWFDGTVMPDMHPVTAVAMVLGITAHTLNALYYADQVVGNFWLELEASRR